MITASSLDRVAVCPGSEHLPQVGHETGGSERGTIIQRYLTDVQTKGRDAALEDVPEKHRAMCESIDLNKLGATELAWEVAIAYDPVNDTARELGRNINRAYVLEPGEIAGTIDVLGVAPGHVVVGDVKAHLGGKIPTADTRQLKFGARAATRLYKKEYARTAIIHLGHDGTPHFDTAELGPADLDAFREELLDIVIRVEGGSAKDLVEGDHCTYCPAIASCPAKARLINALAATNEGEAVRAVQAVTGGPITNSTAALAWHRALLAEKAIKMVRENLKEYATHHLIDLGDGTAVFPKVVEEESFLPVAVEEVMEAQGYSAVVIGRAVSLKTSKSAIREAIREEAPRGTLAARERAVHDEIRKRGGARMTTSVEVRAWKR